MTTYVCGALSLETTTRYARPHTRRETQRRRVILRIVICNIVRASSASDCIQGVPDLYGVCRRADHRRYVPRGCSRRRGVCENRFRTRSDEYRYRLSPPPPRNARVVFTDLANVSGEDLRLVSSHATRHRVFCKSPRDTLCTTTACYDDDVIRVHEWHHNIIAVGIITPVW